MKKYIALLFLLCNCCFSSISQINKSNVFNTAIIDYKSWLINNKYIEKNDTNVWILYIYKSDTVKHKYEFLISFTKIIVKTDYYKGFFINDGENVFVNSRINDTCIFKSHNIKPVNNKIIDEVNKNQYEITEILFDPMYRLVKIKKKKTKINDIVRFSDLPKKYYIK